MDMCMETEDNTTLAKAKNVTTIGNRKIMGKLIKDWALGPLKATVDRSANKPYWKRIAAIWGITEVEARRRVCSNCEYGESSPEFIAAMEHVPDSAVDLDGGGRVWCDKFDFICHNLRTCQRWDPKDSEEED